MEKYIFIIKCVSTINNITKVDNCYAVSSEEEAIQDVKKMESRNKSQPIYNCEIHYIYEIIRLYD